MGCVRALRVSPGQQSCVRARGLGAHTAHVYSRSARDISSTHSASHLVSPSPVSQCFPRPRTCRPSSLACPSPLAARPLVTSLPAAPLRISAPSPPAAPLRPHPARFPGSQSSPVTQPAAGAICTPASRGITQGARPNPKLIITRCHSVEAVTPVV